MVASGPGARPEAVAQGVFEVITHLGLSVPRGRSRRGDLKEIEFLTLALLHDHGTMIVGDIQRMLGVLPAQMSRVIRSLEGRDAPMISCHINTRDKRKIDVCMTDAGAKALHDYQSARIQHITELLRKLPEEDQEELNRLLDKLHHLLASQPLA